MAQGCLHIEENDTDGLKMFHMEENDVEGPRMPHMEENDAVVYIYDHCSVIMLLVLCFK